MAQGHAVKHRVALAVNSPVGWFAKSVAASAYVALDPHNALRGSVAFYPDSGGLRSILSSGSFSGRFRDVGAAWVWYPRRAWDGFTFEAGVLLRGRRSRAQPELEDITKVVSTTYAGRAMIGWSWLVAERAFLSIAAGLSIGREIGTETITPDWGGGMKTMRSIDRPQVDGEGYVRLGFAFGG